MGLPFKGSWTEGADQREWWDGLAVVGVEAYEPVFDVVIDGDTGRKMPRMLGWVWHRYSFEEIELLRRFASSLPRLFHEPY